MLVIVTTTGYKYFRMISPAHSSVDVLYMNDFILHHWPKHLLYK